MFSVDAENWTTQKINIHVTQLEGITVEGEKEHDEEEISYRVIFSVRVSLSSYSALITQVCMSRTSSLRWHMDEIKLHFPIFQ